MNAQDYFTRERIAVFCFLVACFIGMDLYQVHAGIIGTYDDEGWEFAGKVGVVFLACFRPALFDQLFATAAAFLGRFVGK